MRKIIAITLMCTLVGCATSGRKITEAQMNEVVEGQTTRQELIFLFGNPTTSIHNSDGTQILGWGYAHIGFAGIRTDVQGVSMIIGPDDKVKGYSRTGSKPMSTTALRQASVAPIASTAPIKPVDQPLSKKEYQDAQIEKLIQESVSYEEYQRRYKAIMAQ